MENIFTVTEENNIKFLENFNEPLTQKIIDKILSTKCEKIIFGEDFNQDVSLLSKLVAPCCSLWFSFKFNQPINKLPLCITQIHIQHKISKSQFNQTLYSLPPNLEYLYMALKHNNPFKKLPSSLTTLMDA